MSSFKTNLRSQVRQTALPKWKSMLPVFEAVMNSFQSIRDREIGKNGRITIEVVREEDLLGSEDRPIVSFIVTDNGVGLTDVNFDSFNTAFSERRENDGGKGLGRFTWLKAFESVQIKSVFMPAGEEALARKFVFNEFYNPDHGMPAISSVLEVGMQAEFIGFKEPYKSQFPKSIDQFLLRLIEHFLLVFLEPECPAVDIIDAGMSFSANELFEKEFRSTATVHSFEINGADFTLHGFNLTTPRLTHHKLIYAANQRAVVSDYLRDYLPNLSGRLSDKDGRSFIYLGILQSPFLSENVNTVRTDFDLGMNDDADASDSELFEAGTTRAQIRKKAIALIQSDLADTINAINETKEEKIRSYVHTDAPQYNVLMKYSGEFIDKISPTASKSDIEIALHSELHKREVNLKKEGSRIIKEAEKLDNYEAYFREFSQFMANYNELGTAALTQYVMHRKILLKFLRQAITLDPETSKYPLEEVVHKLIFPMRSSSDDIPSHEQNLWIVDERLSFHSYISSDKQLRSNSGRLESDSKLRPDLFVFDEKVVFSSDKPNENPINSVTIIEFKKPGRNNYTADDNPVRQSIKLVQKIRAGKFIHNGRPVAVSGETIPATIYAICDLTESLREELNDFGALITPDKQGYYGFHPNHQIYYEVMDYNKLLRDAEKRNHAFFEKLNISGGFAK